MIPKGLRRRGQRPAHMYPWGRGLRDTTYQDWDPQNQGTCWDIGLVLEDCVCEALKEVPRGSYSKMMQ